MGKKELGILNEKQYLKVLHIVVNIANLKS